MEVIGLWRYPVKSLQGEALTSAEVESDGFVGDRRWGIRDESTGRILTARRRPELLAAAAALDGDTPVITLPGGRTLSGPGQATDAALSEWLGSRVSLARSAGSAPGRAEAFTDATDDSSAAYEWTMPEGRFVDASPILLLSSTSLRTAAGLHPSGTWDVRRFRPNVLVAADGEGWPEDSWIGATWSSGEVELEPVEQCSRCTMVTRPQPGGLQPDVEIFRTLARHHRGRFGVWSDVRNAGTLTVGDTAQVSPH